MSYLAISKEWTTRELREYIRQETQSANYKLIEYYASTTNPLPSVVKMEERLKRLGTDPKRKTKFEDNVPKYIGLGLANKTKAELLMQARALEEFNQYDIFTPKAQFYLKKQEEKQYKAFVKNRREIYGDEKQITRREYRQLVETMGALATGIQDFNLGSDTIVTLFKDTPKEKRVDIVKEFVNLTRENKGAGLNQEQFVDRLRERLGI